MLNYGAAAQKLFGYNDTDLANSVLTEEDQANATQSVTLENKQDKGEKGVGSTLVLESNIVLTMYFKNITRDMRAVVTFTDHANAGHTIEVSGEDFVELNGTSYLGIRVEELVIADARQLVTCQIYDGETLVDTAIDSVESYAYRAAGPADEAVANAVMKFADSAYAYLHRDETV